MLIKGINALRKNNKKILFLSVILTYSPSENETASLLIWKLAVDIHRAMPIIDFSIALVQVQFPFIIID